MIGGEHLYLIQSFCTGAFKVGRSSNPERRLRDLQVGSPFKLKIILVVKNQGTREKRVHDALHAFRSQGEYEGEWFIEPGLGSLPDDLYAMLDLEDVNTWWETELGPVHPPGPLRMPSGREHTPPPGMED